VTYTDQCPPCGKQFSGENREALADAVIAHARDEHDHVLTREHVLAHIDGKDPHLDEG
jgi:predicted small metal-binding protein